MRINKTHNASGGFIPKTFSFYCKIPKCDLEIKVFTDKIVTFHFPIVHFTYSLERFSKIGQLL